MRPVDAREYAQEKFIPSFFFTTLLEQMAFRDGFDADTCLLGMRIHANYNGVVITGWECLRPDYFEEVYKTMQRSTA